MVGGVEQGTLTLTGDQWIERGGGYLMVDLSADLLAAANTLTHLEGEVTYDGCGGFSLQRTAGA
jgi:hypothetical protein